ncbi:MAG: hypothetical protein KatS3mg024_1947 [Armatimonadota bacterium]|nr:MAG: hypothetical protein KatS3mg024_1947 [Armatimonadota bacterium]
MLRLIGLLLAAVLVAGIAYQTWQTAQMRKEIRLLSRQIAVESVPVPARVDNAALSEAGDALEQAAKAARQGDLARARSLARSGYLMLDPDSRVALDAAPLLRELTGGAADFLKKQLGGLYEPQKTKEGSR